MTLATTVTAKGQVTIPISLREILGIKPGQKIKFLIEPKSRVLKLKPLPDFAELRGFFKTDKKFDKKSARQIYIKEVAAGKI